METNKKNELELQSNKDILMYYQTTIRNVALTTAVSFAALAYSRFYREKSLIYSSGLTFVSLLIIFASCIININLYNFINNHYKTDISLISANNHLVVNILFMISHLIIILFGLFTFYRLVTNSKFK
tara:strand:+ start:2310 stop:2690 length:381 start_codon:yes stop_codon:yes gene_type:complete